MNKKSDISATLREKIIELVHDTPHTESSLYKHLKSKLTGETLQERKENLVLHLSKLVKDGSLHELPPYLGQTKNTKVYSAKSADPVDYLNDAASQIAERLGISIDDVINPGRNKTALEVVTEQIGNPDERCQQLKLAANRLR